MSLDVSGMKSAMRSTGGPLTTSLTRALVGVFCSALLSAVGCGSVSTDLPAGELAGRYAESEVVRALVSSARDAEARGEQVRAGRLADEALELDPSAVDAARLRQDQLRRDGRLGLLLSEARERVARSAGSAGSQYLLGRALTEPAEREAAFDRALERDPSFFWGWLGKGFAASTDEPDAAIRIFEQMLERTGGDVWVERNLGLLLLREERYDEALVIYERLGEREGEEARSRFGRARALLGLLRTGDSYRATLEGIVLDPRDRSGRDLLNVHLATGVPDAGIEYAIDLLFTDEVVLDAFCRSGGDELVVSLLQRSGRSAEATEILRRYEGRRARPANLASLDLGQVEVFFRGLEAWLPRFAIEAEDNQLRGRWLYLFDGPWREMSDEQLFADGDVVVSLVLALLDCGLLEEAEHFCAAAALRSQALDQGFDTLRARVQAESRFLRAMKRRLYAEFGADEPRALEDLLDGFRRDSEVLLGRDVVGEPRIHRVPFVGALIDPFGPGLAEWLRSRNKHLEMGQVSGGPADGFLFTRVSLRDLDADSAFPLPNRSLEVLGDAREIRSLQTVAGGDLAGVALIDHYAVDLQAVREWAADLTTIRERSRAQGDVILRDPIPPLDDPLDPLDAQTRLTVRAEVETGQMFAAVLDLVCWHERAHLADAARYLPPEKRVLRSLALVLGHGFDPDSILSELEGRAELAALAFTDHPDLVLAHIADFASKRGAESPHVRGFVRAARWLNEELEGEDGIPVGIASWPQIEPERMQAAARRIAARLWP